MDRGCLIISLDLELCWGLRHHPQDYWLSRVMGARRAIPRMLELFEKYGIHATWAAVGFLFFEGWDELQDAIPDIRPSYDQPGLDPYEYIESQSDKKPCPEAHFAPDLIANIRSGEHQEIATHTFSHYYCAEPGHTPQAFRADLQASIDAAARLDIRPRSIVFPKNQISEDCLPICRELGIRAYRGVFPGWLYRFQTLHAPATRFRRVARLIDEHLPLGGHNCYSLDDLSPQQPYNLPGSRLLRPLRDQWFVSNALRLRRILASMSHAAKNGLIYHLWWHPHNFGVNMEAKLDVLEAILQHFSELRDVYGMVSLNMVEGADLVEDRSQ